MPHPSERFDPQCLLQLASTIENDTPSTGPVPIVSALVVEPVPQDAASIVEMLTACRFRVAVADTFSKARRHLSAHPPAALLTEVRLAAYNGLHLVLRGKSVRPDMAAIVLSRVADPVLEAEAVAMGATFVLKPVHQRELRAAVFRTLCTRFHSRRVSVAMRPPFERRNDERRAALQTQTLERRRAERRRDLVTVLRSLNTEA